MRNFATYAELNSALALDPLEPGAFRFAKQFAPATFTCHRCGHHRPLNFEGGSTGYGVSTKHMVERGHVARANEMVCFICAGQTDSIDMVADGKGTLYLTLPECVKGRDVEPSRTQWGTLTNWPGTMEFKFHKSALKRGHHNIAGSRYDVWFTGPDNKPWHGVQYGENTQLCHCKRVKA